MQRLPDAVIESRASLAAVRSAAAPVLSVRRLSVAFPGEQGRVRAVRDISYDVAPGEILAIVGESGSGKSVGALAVMGLLPPHTEVHADEVRFEGRNLLALTPAEMRALRGGGIGMIFQDPMTALNPVMTVGDQLTEPLRQHLGLGPQQAQQRALELLGLVGIPDAVSRLAQYPHQFSGGMRQRVMIAIGLSCNPRLLIADEPTTALDVTIQAQILELMQSLCRRLGVALVLITHNLGIVSRYADRVLVMYGGRLMEQGATTTVLRSPRHLYTAGLLSSVPTLEGPLTRRLSAIEGTPPNPVFLPPGCPFAPRCQHAQSACADEPVVARTDVGTESACRRAGEMAAHRLQWRAPVPAQARDAAVPALTPLPMPPADAGPLLQVESLEKHYAARPGFFSRGVGVKAVRDVSLSIHRRETVGVVGESGCGKSTLGRLLLRLEEPTAGRILFRGEDITHRRHNALRDFRRQAQVVFQDPYSSLNPRQRVADCISEPMRVHKLAGSAQAARAEAERLLGLVGLRPDHADRFAHQLSGGQRQRVAIARALAMQPEFIVCDEAVSALDVSVQAQIVNLLADLQERLHLSYLFIGHDLAVVRQIATRVVVMYLGRVVEIAERDQFYSQPQHPYSQLLMSAVPGLGDGAAGAARAAIPIRGEPPSPSAPPSGCAFRTRCPVAMPACAEQMPPLHTLRGGHQVACLRHA